MAQLTGAGARWRDVDHAAPGSDPITFALLKGTPGDDSLHGRKDSDTIEGLGGDDLLNGRYGDDTLDGGDGDDVLKGTAGRDVLNGGAGEDVLYGGSEGQERGDGVDQLFGGRGNDRLTGGFDSDALTGGTGHDSFIYTAASDSSNSEPDYILDFEQGADQLVFRDLGVLSFIGNADFSHTAGEVRFDIFPNDTQIFIDLDGDGSSDMLIDCRNQIQLQQSDFSF